MSFFIGVCLVAVTVTLLISRGNVLRGVSWGFAVAGLACLGGVVDVARSDGIRNAVIVALAFACQGAWLGGAIDAFRQKNSTTFFVSLGSYAVFAVYCCTLFP